MLRTARAAIALLSLIAAACGAPEAYVDLRDVPALTGVAPVELRPGEALTLQGRFLDRALGVFLRGPAERQLDFVDATASAVTLTVPEDVPSGVWTVTLRDDAWREPTGSATFELWRPDTERPCHKRYSLKVETERLIRHVAVDRRLIDDTTEHLSFLGDELRSIERRVEAGCTSIWLHTSDGRQVLLADDPSRDLALQATTLAEALGLPLGLPTEEAPGAEDDAVPDEAGAAE